MNSSGDAAEQVVRLSLEGFEVVGQSIRRGGKEYCRTSNFCSQTGTENKGKGKTYKYD